MLTAEQVHAIRTEGRTDIYFATKYRTTVGTIRYARIGKSWANHPTPPDTKPRMKVGNWDGL
jgi:hypothetical protein